MSAVSSMRARLLVGLAQTLQGWAGGLSRWAGAAPGTGPTGEAIGEADPSGRESPGPPAHWIERVRQGAPGLLLPGAVEATPEAPTRRGPDARPTADAPIVWQPTRRFDGRWQMPEFPSVRAVAPARPDSNSGRGGSARGRQMRSHRVVTLRLRRRETSPRRPTAHSSFAARSGASNRRPARSRPIPRPATTADRHNEAPGSGTSRPDARPPATPAPASGREPNRTWSSPLQIVPAGESPRRPGDPGALPALAWPDWTPAPNPEAPFAFSNADPWPELPVEPPQIEDWARALRDWERRQRLEREQRGVL
jgi:hypothetical protein